MLTRLYRTILAFLRKPTREPVVLLCGGCIYVHPVHYNRVVANLPKPGDRHGSLGRAPTCATVHSDPFTPAWRYPTRWESVKARVEASGEEWRR